MRDEDADVAGRRIDAAEEGDADEEADRRGLREDKPGRDHQRRAGDQQIAQIVTRRDEADGEREQRGAEQSGGGDEADLGRVEADRGQIGGQHDDSKSIAEAAQGARDIEQMNIGKSSLSIHAQSSRKAENCAALGRGCRLMGRLRIPVPSEISEQERFSQVSAASAIHCKKSMP